MYLLFTALQPHYLLFWIEDLFKISTQCFILFEIQIKEIESRAITLKEKIQKLEKRKQNPQAVHQKKRRLSTLIRWKPNTTASLTRCAP